MRGGNGQKSKMALGRNMEKNKSAKGSRLESNKKSMTIKGKERVQTFIGTTSEVEFALKQSSRRMISNEDLFSFDPSSFLFHREESRLESNKKSMTIKGKERMQTFIGSTSEVEFAPKQSRRRLNSSGSWLELNKKSMTIQGKERVQTFIGTTSEVEFALKQSSRRMISSGSRLESNKKSMTIQCKERVQTFIGTTSELEFTQKQSSRRMISAGVSPTLSSSNARRKVNIKIK